MCELWKTFHLTESFMEKFIKNDYQYMREQIFSHKKLFQAQYTQYLYLQPVKQNLKYISLRDNEQ